jgi:hypothetical protein
VAGGVECRDRFRTALAHPFLWAPQEDHVRVSGEDKFTAAVGLHPSDTKKSTDALSRAKGQVGGVKCMYNAVNNLARGKHDRNPH